MYIYLYIIPVWDFWTYNCAHCMNEQFQIPSVPILTILKCSNGELLIEKKIMVTKNI